MKKLFLLLIVSLSLFAKVKVAVTYPYIGQIAKEVAGDLIELRALSNPTDDPHFVTPKPSLIVKLRDADLLITNGAELEDGWITPLVQKANNPNINSNTLGSLVLANSIELIQKPVKLDRSLGHVHSSGNPHFSLDPHIIPILAKSVANRLSLIDPNNSNSYQSNYQKFKIKWQRNLKVWDKKMSKVRGLKVVQYHKLFDYFIKRYRLDSIATIEPIPGINPSSKHLISLVDKMKQSGVKVILQDVYHSHKSAKFLEQKSGARVFIMPHDVGAVQGTETLESFFNYIVSGLIK
jgi:zinc/manganese transport system substrate-binding protein